MWDSWTRNFSSPLNALLDLLDNSFDAAMRPSSTGNDVDDEEPATGATDNCRRSYRGKIVVNADKFQSVAGSAGAVSPTTELTTGITITNNSWRKIKPMDYVLEAYSSAKGRDERADGIFAETIGENGVGLKQSCATLTDMSFVLARNDDNLSLGILAEALQPDNGMCLPSFDLKSKCKASLRNELVGIFMQYRDELGKCAKQYGEGSLVRGVDRIVNHFGEILALEEEEGWGREEYVFRVILHRLKTNSKGPSANDEAAEATLLYQLAAELPRHYIHIPPSFEVKCDGNKVDFGYYWQRRLVELTSFYQNIDPNVPVLEQKEDWKHPVGPGSYTIRIICGFDRRVMCGFDKKKKKKKAKLIIYSRHSGRLIKEEADCRTMLGLGSSSSDFTQGLTIIVDDLHGHLPLTPTKEDIAFAEPSNGQTHEGNLYKWVSAIACTYWQLHFKLRFKQSKKALTAAVTRFADTQDNGFDSTCKCLDESSFTEFRNIQWKYNKANDNIRCVKYEAIKTADGTDTRWRFDNVCVDAELRASTCVAPAARKPRMKKRKMGETTSNATTAVTATCRDENGNALGAREHNLMAPGASLHAAPQGDERAEEPNNGPDYKALYEESKQRCDTLQEELDSLREKLEVLFMREKYYKKNADEFLDDNIALNRQVKDLSWQVEDLSRQVKYEHQSISQTHAHI